VVGWVVAQAVDDMRDGAAGANGILLVPPVPPAPGLRFDIAALLPNRDHNADLIDLLADLGTAPIGPPVFAGILAGDPFLPEIRLLQALRSANIIGVANLPSIGQFGSAFEAHMDQVASGVGREFEVLERFGAAGLRTAAMIVSPHHAERAVSIGADPIIVAPDASLLEDEPGKCADAVTRTATAVREYRPDVGLLYWTGSAEPRLERFQRFLNR